jgi:hypothetical protein
MKIIASHSSATAREHTPHVNRTTRTNTIVNALKRRAQAVLNDKSIDARSRAIIRYALETNDPWLAELVRRADAGEDVIEDMQNIETNNEDDASEEKIAALAEIICCSGDEPARKSAALVVLMAALEHAHHPKALANSAKHIAFTRCGELTFCDIVDVNIPVFESELLRE